MSKSIIVAGNLVVCKDQGKRFAVRGRKAWGGAIGEVHFGAYCTQDYIRFHAFEMRELIDWCNQNPNYIQEYYYSNS